MKEQKYHIYLTEQERSEVIKSLIDLKNTLIRQGKYTDAVDDLLVKLTGAKRKKRPRKEKFQRRLSAEFLVTGLQCLAHDGAETQACKRICARMVRNQCAHCAGRRLGVAHPPGIYRHP